MPRSLFVLKLHCAKCKSALEFERISGNTAYVSGQPTGCEMVETALSVEPCHCMTDGPNRLKESLKSFLSN